MLQNVRAVYDSSSADANGLLNLQFKISFRETPSAHVDLCSTLEDGRICF